jgi:hypothetical protein
MILVPDPAMLEDIPTDSDAGGPYVMWQGTSYAHIMMPTGPRPKWQRAPAALLWSAPLDQPARQVPRRLTPSAGRA